MNLTIKKSRAVGDFKAPPSKSFCHRALICAALSKGISTVHGISLSDDISATVDCLRRFGADIKTDGDTAYILGCDFLRRGELTLDCRQSGTTLRFITAIALLSESKTILTGSPRLMERTMTAYEDMFAEKGFEFLRGGDKITVSGGLKCGAYNLRADVSSQFVSGIMLALGSISGDSEIIIHGNIVSRPYIEITRAVMCDFGVLTDFSDNIITVHGGTYMPADYTVEGDCSNAAFFEAINRLNSDINISGINKNAVQGDGIYNTLFDALDRGCAVIDITDCPDLAPVLMAYGACRYGVTLNATARLCEKESDRGRNMSEELKKFGVSVTHKRDSLTVIPAEIKSPTELISSHGDHRIVMACTVLLMLTGGTIAGADDVSKSFPDFFDILRGLGVTIE